MDHLGYKLFWTHFELNFMISQFFEYFFLLFWAHGPRAGPRPMGPGRFHDDATRRGATNLAGPGPLSHRTQGPNTS